MPGDILVELFYGKINPWEDCPRNIEELRGLNQKMSQLKVEGKEKSATYRQLMGNKLQYQNMLSLYRIYGLVEDDK